MYPQCYRSAYARHLRAHLEACAASRRIGRLTACYPNSGSFEGASAALLPWLRAVIASAEGSAGALYGGGATARPLVR